MAKNQEEIRATVPANNSWHTKELEEKAAKYGMKKSDFVFMAVDAFINFDDEFLQTLKKQSARLHIPMYIMIQNTIISNIAKNRAKNEVCGGMPGQLDEYPMFSDASDSYMLTGKALEEYLFDQYVKEFRQKKEENGRDLVK